MNSRSITLGILFMQLLFLIGIPAVSQNKEAPVQLGKGGHLQYHADSLGDRIPDFSYCGYMSGNDTIPDVPIRIVVPEKEGDATLRIQSALNYVSHLPKDTRGIRGAVLLEKGTYKVFGRLKIDSSGVVLRGSGMQKDGTVLIAEGQSRATFIRVLGQHDMKLCKTVKITDAYVPVGSDEAHVPNPHAFKAGNHIIVQRPCTEKWIKQLGMVDFGGQSGWLGWKPGDENIDWDRKITAIRGNELVLDVPLTTAIDSTYGGGTVAVYHWPGRISQIGIENLRLVSTYDTSNPKDEAHCWMAITMENVQDAWVRQVVFEHFAGSAVFVLPTARRITVQDCESLAPVSEIGGQRRNIFWTMGQQTLFQRLYSEYGYHDFAVGFCAAGPNAFVQCKAHLPYSFSGSINSWASGVLFDNVRSDGGALSFKNLGQYDHGAGWNAANSVFWQCDAAMIACYKPPTAENWAFGCWSQPAGHGYWGHPNEHIHPFSLYYGQLQDRLGKDVSDRSHLMQITTNETSSPTVEEAAELSALSVHPGPLLRDWIDKAYERDPIPISAVGIKTIASPPPLPSGGGKGEAREGMCIQNGWLVREGKVLTGTRDVTPWWRGDVQPEAIKEALPAVTRYVPGRIGRGLTDDLNQVADSMKDNHIVAFEQNYGLWYDTRRDDHERVRRMNGNAWPPFYELPFARSGIGTAWDGLSKYDLTKYNVWYWSRLKKFADLADQKGLVLIYKDYFQHNILEAGAHWVDFPWRTVNNINHTGFPEPPPYAGDKRQFMAAQFYDTANVVRRKLHIAFIQKCLENFENNSNVIQLTCAEYTGPLEFMQFWVDVIKRWEQKTRIKECIGLSATKDVQDAILSDPERSPVINVIDIRHWYYEANGVLYAPQGGKHLAPRQWARLLRPKGSSFEQVYRAVREYRDKYPDKAIIYSAGNYDHFGWAVFMAGGSLATIPVIEAPDLLTDAAHMHPVDLPDHPSKQWALADPGKGYIIYNDSDMPVSLDLKKYTGRFMVRWINPVNGHLLSHQEKLRGGRTVEIKDPQHGAIVISITKSGN